MNIADPSTAKDQSEAEWVRRCQSGDPRAEIALVGIHAGRLHRTLFRVVGNWALAEDLVQESFIKTFEQIARIDPQQGLRGWLFRTAFNLARNHRKRGGHASAALAEVETQALVLPRPPDPEESAMAAEERRRIADLVATLPLPMRQALVLHYMEGMGFGEMARILGTPAPILKMRAHRARKRLRSMLGGCAS